VVVAVTPEVTITVLADWRVVLELGRLGLVVDE
jgi:hypothetical protein